MKFFVRDGLAFYFEPYGRDWGAYVLDCYHVLLGAFLYDWHRLVDDARD